MNNENGYKLIRILPYVKFENRIKNGKKYVVEVKNLSNVEIDNMSCESRMLWPDGDNVYYPAELPLSLRGFGTGAQSFCCFMFDELNEIEKEKYFDKTVMIKSSTDVVVKIYGEKSKSLFGKIRRKSKEVK